MDRDQLSHIAHRWHPIAAPLSPESVDRLLARVPVPAAAETPRILDLGCGAGQWLVRLLELHPHASGVGVDRSPHAIGQARELAADHRVDDRIELVTTDASTVELTTADVVLCVGATHIFGGLDATLAAIAEVLQPGGAVVLGEGFWTVPPTPEAMAALGVEDPAELPDLDAVAAAVAAAGLAVRTAHVSTQEEWDEYEWAWCGALREWAASEPDVPDADRDQAREVADAHLRAYEDGYRGVLGFTTLVLASGGPAGRV